MTLAARGYAILIANADEDAALQAKLVASMIEHGVSALVISPAYGATDATFDPLARSGLPVLQVLRRVDARTDLFPFSSFDYAAGSAEATRHLIDRGARRIAFVGGLPGRAITQERRSGWCEVLKAEGRDRLALHGKSSRAFGMQTAETLIADHPDVDAAICFNDLVALGLIAGFARAGRPVGDGFRLVGFDDIEEAAQSWPQLSSVGCDIAGFARDTAARLLSWMTGGERPPPELRSPVHLVARVTNVGGMDAPAGLPLSLYRVDGELSTLLETVFLEDPLPSGTTTAGIEFSLTLGETGSTAMAVVIDDDGAGGSRIDECDESDNVGTWLVDGPC